MASCHTLQRDLEELKKLKESVTKPSKNQSAAVASVEESGSFVVFKSDDESNIAEVNSVEMGDRPSVYVMHVSLR